MSARRNKKSNFARGQWLTYHTNVGTASEMIGSMDYFKWLEGDGNTSFHVESGLYDYTLRREKRRQKYYWYAFKKLNDVLYKVYCGQSDKLTSHAIFREIPLKLDDKINGDYIRKPLGIVSHE